VRVSILRTNEKHSRYTLYGAILLPHTKSSATRLRRGRVSSGRRRRPTLRVDRERGRYRRPFLRKGRFPPRPS